MSYIAYAIGAIIMTMLWQKYEGTMPGKETYIILAILTSAEVICSELKGMK